MYTQAHVHIIFVVSGAGCSKVGFPSVGVQFVLDHMTETLAIQHCQEE